MSDRTGRGAAGTAPGTGPADGNSKNGMTPYLSPVAVCALSIGSAIGWGSLVVTSRSYLSQAGPLGSVIGLLIGLALMLMIARHYHFLANRYPGTGGLYNYVKYVFGYDRAFLAAWFLFLVYISIFWANATSVPLFARYFLHNVFSFGYLYTIFGYEVYLGEALVTLAVILLVALLCIKSKKATARTMTGLAALFTVGITVCFIAAMAGHGGTGMTMEPGFIPDKSAFRQVLRIAFISPWAFIGFESVSHSAAEYRFRHSRMFRVLVISLIITTALYIFTILLSISAYPDGCSGWLDYIRRLDEFDGIEGLPAFYAAHYYLGDAGVYILMASLLSLVITSLIGMLRAVSRLCYAVARDGILPERFSKLNKKQIPVNAILLTVLVSLPIPFLGRTAIGWIVDTTTIGATIIYGFAAMAVFKASKEEGCKKDHLLSGICTCILGVFLIFLLFPGVFSDNTIETETYALMTVWSVLGLFFFNRVIRKDHARKFGRAIVVWIALLAFIVLMALTWAERVKENRENAIVDEIVHYVDGTADSETLAMDREAFFAAEREKIHDADNISVLAVGGLFCLSLGVMFVNYASMKKWENKAAEERDQARIAAFTDPLTGVKSKHAFAVQEGQIETKIADGEAEAFSVIVCDVNGLKKINDTLGHKAGDEYIRDACRMLCEYWQHSPVFRIGGDEFAVLPGGCDYENREKILQEFNRKIEENIGCGKVVASLGMADYDREKDQSFHEVFQRADGRMYERKTQLKKMGAATRD